jgi:hypothetical protein
VARVIVHRAEDDDCPLEVDFVDGELEGRVTPRCEIPGPPQIELDDGVWDLSRPQMLAAIIRIGRAEGWAPRARRSLPGARGFEWLSRHAWP